MSATIGYLALGYVMLAALALFVSIGIIGLLHKKERLQFLTGTFLLLIIFITSLVMLLFGETYEFLNIFVIYPFSAFFVALFAIGFIMINIISYEYSNNFLQFSLLFGFVALGAFSIALANSFITIFLGIELISVPTAFMIMLNGRHYIEAAAKLFILSAIAISVFAFALALIFPYDPQLTLSDLSIVSTIHGGYLTVLALFLFISALAFDASLFPFNLWVPDVFAGSPANITALLAGVNKKVAFVALFEILFIVMSPYIGVFSLAFQVLAIMTMFFGNLVALVQTNVKRLFAYSSISQAGYIAIGFAVATQYGIQASMFQILAHTFMIIGTFAIILWLESKGLKTISDYSGLSYRNAFAGVALTVFMLSMIGIPPLIGFTGKLLLFSSAISSGLLLLAVVGILNSFISVYYYAKVILAMFSKKDGSELYAGWSINTVVAICLLVVILLGIFPSTLISIISIAAGSVLG